MKINWKAIPEGLKILGKIVEENKSTILVGAGIAGWIGTAILVGKTSPKAKTAITKAKYDKIPESDQEYYESVDKIHLTPMETVKATWQYYIPAVGAGLASSAAIIWAHKIDLGKIASITASYQLAKNQYDNLKDKIVEKDGEEKLKEYKSEVQRDTLRRESGGVYILDTGKGDTVFYEPTTRTWFYHDIWHVEKVLTRALDDCKTEGMVHLEQILDELGIPTTPLTREYVIFEDAVKDIRMDRVTDLFCYHAIDAENGDNRPCIWLDIEDRIANLQLYESGGSFRYRR